MTQLEATNYKIDSTGRKVKQFVGYVDGTKTKIKCKINNEGDIREYVSGMPDNLIGEQLFTWNAVKRLGIEERLPKYEDFKSENHSKFLKDNNIIFPGYWYPSNKIFSHLNTRADCWLADGYGIVIYKDNITHDHTTPECGFSVRLVKELDTTIGQVDHLVERAENIELNYELVQDMS